MSVQRLPLAVGGARLRRRPRAELLEAAREMPQIPNDLQMARLDFLGQIIEPSIETSLNPVNPAEEKLRHSPDERGHEHKLRSEHPRDRQQVPGSHQSRIVDGERELQGETRRTEYGACNSAEGKEEQ